MKILILILGIILSILGLVKFKNKDEKIISLLWLLSFLFLFFIKLDFIEKLNAPIYMPLIIINTALMIRLLFRQYSGKYKILSIVFVLLVLSIMRDAFHLPYFNEFLIIQIVISLPILIYIFTKSIKNKDSFITFLASLFVLNELIRYSSLIGIN